MLPHNSQWCHHLSSSRQRLRSRPRLPSLLTLHGHSGSLISTISSSIHFSPLASLNLSSGHHHVLFGLICELALTSLVPFALSVMQSNVFQSPSNQILSPPLFKTHQDLPFHFEQNWSILPWLSETSSFSSWKLLELSLSQFVNLLSVLQAHCSPFLPRPGSSLSQDLCTRGSFPGSVGG